jgi:hypothetical protein
MPNLSREFLERVNAVRSDALLRINAVRGSARSKAPRNKKVLGLALGERSLLVAEVVSGDKLVLTRAAEMVYPAGVSITTPTELGSALASFIAEQGFSARAAVVGLPARWLVTQTKEVPAADQRTTSEMLRLSAEAEFSTELKDLVYDYTGSGTSVLLVATPHRYIAAANAICESAKLNLMTVTATALALGEATGRAAARDVLVLAVASGGAEMTLQRDACSGALRHLRPPQPEAAFINELRRTVSTMPATKGSREVILWDDAGLNAVTLAGQINASVSNGELSLLGVTSGSIPVNGNGLAHNGPRDPAQSRQYAAAVALALEGLADRCATVDFLHSRLAPPKQHKVPRWAIIAAAALVILVACTLYAFHDLQVQSTDVDARQAKYDSIKGHIDEASEFVSKVSFAQAWHGGDPRYLACIRDMTLAMQDDADTFAIGLLIGDAPHLPKTPDTHALTGMLQGKAEDQQHVLKLLTRLRRFPGFVEVTNPGSDAGRAREVTFSISFRYQGSKAAR